MAPVTKTKQHIPTDISTLARWLALDPKKHVKEIETLLTRSTVAEYERLAEKTVDMEWTFGADLTGLLDRTTPVEASSDE